MKTCEFPERSAVEHGGPNLAELHRLGVEPAQLLDFSVCTNPFGPSPLVHKAITQVSLEQYPDRDCTELRAALAEKLAVSPQEILPGNGVSELIWLAALAFVRPKQRIFVIGPTYGEYERAALLQGGAVTTWKARQQDQFAPVPHIIEAELKRCRPHMVFLCNPNNPTGSTLDPELIRAWVGCHPETLFVVDEAYQAFVPGLASLVPVREINLLVLRSMTKDYALAGLRIGYAVGAEEVIAALARVQPPWSVNALAQAAAVAALGDEPHLRQSLESLRCARQALTVDLMKLGLEVCPSAAHFFLVHVGAAAAFRLALLKRGILVRDAASFGLPAFIRLATRKPEENAKLLTVLREGF